MDQPSAITSDAPAPADIRLPVGEIDHEFIRKFRKQIHALGAVWIGLAVLGAALMSALPSLTQTKFVLSPLIVGVFGLYAAWVVLGVLSCLKRMGAVKVALGLSYVAVALQLWAFFQTAGTSQSPNPLPLIILGAIILQAHRVIGWAGQMQQAGIPLTFRP